jgi:hypothetical protein
MARADRRPQKMINVADCVPRGFSFARSDSGVTSMPRTLISSVPISCLTINRLIAFKSKADTSRSSNAVKKGLFTRWSAVR